MNVPRTMLGLGLAVVLLGTAGAAPPDIVTTAELISQETQGNPDFAAKYKGKVVEVVGTSLPRDKPNQFTPKGLIGLSGAPIPYSTQRVKVLGIPLPADAAKSEAIPAGRKVRLVGKVSGTHPMSFIIDDCTVTDLGPGTEPTPVRDAAEVAAAFAGGEAAARKKLGAPEKGPFLLIVKGTVTMLTPSGKTTTVRVGPPDGPSVEGAIREQDAKAIRKDGKARLGGLFQGYDPATKTLKLQYASGCSLIGDQD